MTAIRALLGKGAQKAIEPTVQKLVPEIAKTAETASTQAKQAFEKYTSSSTAKIAKQQGKQLVDGSPKITPQNITFELQKAQLEETKAQTKASEAQIESLREQTKLQERATIAQEDGVRIQRRGMWCNWTTALIGTGTVYVGLKGLEDRGRIKELEAEKQKMQAEIEKTAQEVKKQELHDKEFHHHKHKKEEPKTDTSWSLKKIFG